MEIHPFVEEGLGNSSYLLGTGDGRALAIDPPRDTRRHRQLAADHGWTIAFSVETHLHADFISGSRELAADGATVVGPHAARLAFPHRGLDDGDELDLGGLRLQALATPGHTPEHLAYLLDDGSLPIALFSGGALLPGSVARTDLIDPARTEPLARSLYRALHERVLTLPAWLPVYPTHGAGSFCSAGVGGDRTTTIGRERAANPLLAAPSEDAFVARLLGTFGSYPTYFGRLREINRRGPRVYGAHPPILAGLAPHEVEAHIAGGAELVDVRPMEAFAAGHIPGALSIALRDAFASWLGWLVPADRSLVFVLGADQDRAELVRQCLKIGYEHFAGELAGGIEAWRASERPEARTELTSDATAVREPVLDVRQAAEFVAGHLPAAHHVELGSVLGHLDDLAGVATVMCGHGERAMSAASLIERVGARPGVFLGGPEDWSRSRGRALVTGP